MRLEARIDERNREIADLKRARDEAPPAPSPYMAARTPTTDFVQPANQTDLIAP